MELVIMVAFEDTVPVGAFQKMAEQLRRLEGIKAVIIAEVPDAVLDRKKITVVGE